MARAGCDQRSILQLLRNEHSNVRRLFDRALRRQELPEEMFALVRSDLEAHMRAEEEIFYPELESEASIREQVLEAYEEHNVGRTLMNELGEMSPGDERWQAKITVLAEVMNQHFEEEEKRIFPAAGTLLGKERESQIASLYLDEKPDLGERDDVESAEEDEEL